jgi:hypothetical protein
MLAATMGTFVNCSRGTVGVFEVNSCHRAAWQIEIILVSMRFALYYQHV